ncbi:MAG: thiamine-phosphate kinase [Brachymonas sp.]|nr:thiamine-phosphate kinase [Brachymonas sp.]
MSTNTRLGEFELIARHFRRQQPLRQAVLGGGDDCALLQPPPGQMLAISTDTLVAGRHFFEDVDPTTLGHKALAVNLSDLAASGAQHLACLLALTLPAVDDAWLAAFASGLYALADAHGCELIGGDTTRGPLAITLTVLGSVPPGQALLRSGAQVGDDIYVSHGPGQGLGDARLALHLLQAQRGLPAAHALAVLDAAQRMTLLQATRPRLEQPDPRIALGLALRGVASACMDLSDGLQGDLRHILAASGVGATLHAASDAGGKSVDMNIGGTAAYSSEPNGLLAACSPAVRSLGDEQAVAYALAGGDDYELLFTAPVPQRAQIQCIARQTGLQLTRIGRIEQEPGLRLLQADGRQVCIQANGFNHFAA